MSYKKCMVKTERFWGFGVCERQIIRDEKCIFHLADKTEEEAQQFKIEFMKEFENNEGELHFEKVIFPDSIGFLLKKIEKPIFFNGAHFCKEALFNGAKFKEKADFSGAKFSGQTDFCEAEFSGEGIFSEAKFKKKADFSEAKFSDETNFFKAEFSGEAIFLRAKFNNIVYFDNAIFCGEVDFGWAKFDKAAYFPDTQFDKKADFYESTFESEGLFTRMIFNNESFIKFRYSQFLKPKYVRFYDVNLSFFSFLCTDITEVEFLKEKWAKKNGRCIVRDESEILKELDTTYDAVAQLYRRLRRNYEDNYRFAEAGDFFMGEMEMRRLDVTPRFRNKNIKKIELLFKRNFSLLGIYKHLSLYGESYFRPAICASIVIIFYPLIIHWLLNLRLPDDSLTYLRTSASSFFQMDNKYVGERLLGILILGLFFISLKRKFERKR